jgi:hypothetical protein
MQIAVVTEGTAGLTGSSSPKPEAGKKEEPAKQAEPAKKEEPPQKKGFGLGNLKANMAPEKTSQQVSASGGARGVGPDRLAKGGDNPNLVKVTLGADELAAFAKGIV